MKKITIILIFIALISKISGFGREVALSHFYGATAVSDAYIIATSLPSTLLAFVGVAITTAYIPMLNKVIESDGEKAGNAYTFNLISAVSAFVLMVFIVFQLFLPNIISVLAMGFDEHTFNLAVSFGHIILFSLFATGPVYILSGFLQVKKKFVVASLIGLPLNIIIIASIIIGARYTPTIMAIGTGIAAYAQMAFLLFHVYKDRPECQYKIDWNDSYIKETLRMSVPVIIGASVNQVNVLIDKTIASTIISGGVSVLNYANRLQYFVQSVFVASMISVLFPALSALAQKNKMQEIRSVIREGLSLINFFLVPATFGILIFSRQIVELLFGRGAFDDKAVMLTSSALFFYSIGMLGFGYREVFAKIMYSLHDTKTPAYNASVGVCVNIALNLMLSKIMGLSGLALATSLSAIITAIGMWYGVRKKVGGFTIITKNAIKIFFASIGMSLLAKIAYSAMSPRIGADPALIGAVFIGVFSYSIIAMILKIEEIDMVKKFLISKTAGNF